jgi:copper chaperone CopZ
MATISIKGMNCPHCVASTKKALEGIPGVSNVTVTLKKNEASYDGDVDIAEIKAAITAIGFEVINI